MMKASKESPQMTKSTYTVWGANHNFYNSEWQSNDSYGCQNHDPLWTDGSFQSPQQQLTGISSVVSFFRTHVGSEVAPQFDHNFDPLYELPTHITSLTRVDRNYVRTPDEGMSWKAEDFSGPEGVGSGGIPHDIQGVRVQHTQTSEQDPSLSIARISWENGGPQSYFQMNWVTSEKALPAHEFQTLDFRVTRTYSALNRAEGSNFGIQHVLS